MQNRGERTHYYIIYIYRETKTNYLNSNPTDLHLYEPGDEWHDRFFAENSRTFIISEITTKKYSPLNLLKMRAFHHPLDFVIFLFQV